MKNVFDYCADFSVAELLDWQKNTWAGVKITLGHYFVVISFDDSINFIMIEFIGKIHCLC